MDDEDSFEHTLLVVREVNAYKIPPRQGSGRYKCAEWLVSDKIWSGRLRLVSLKERCEIRLEDSNSGELFASCLVQAGSRESSVESVSDSSRYFVLKLDDGRGRHAFIGLGFNERNEAFDFNVALTDHEKHVVAEREQKEGAGREELRVEGAAGAPALDLRLKEGQTIKINVKALPPPSATAPSSARSSKKLTLLPPPPSATSAASSLSAHAAPTGTVLMPLAPPPGDVKARGRPAGEAGGDRERGSQALPKPSTSAAAAQVTQSSHSAPVTGWAAF